MIIIWQNPRSKIVIFFFSQRFPAITGFAPSDPFRSLGFSTDGLMAIPIEEKREFLAFGSWEE